MIIFWADKTLKLNTCCKIQGLDTRRAYINYKIFPDAGPKSDACGDEKQGIYFVWTCELDFFKFFLYLFIKTPGKLHVSPNLVTSYLGNGQSIFDSLESSPRLTPRSN